MNSRFVGMMVLTVALVACGDNGGTGGTGGAGGAGGAGGGGAPSIGGAGNPSTGGGENGGGPSTGDAGGPAALTCADACSLLYDCGVEGENCPGFTGDLAEKAAFVGDETGGCIQWCNDQPALINLVEQDDPGDNCESAVATLKSVSPDFADLCDNGFSQKGGGAGS